MKKRTRLSKSCYRPDCALIAITQKARQWLVQQVFRQKQQVDVSIPEYPCIKVAMVTFAAVARQTEA